MVKPTNLFFTITYYCYIPHEFSIQTIQFIFCVALQLVSRYWRNEDAAKQNQSWKSPPLNKRHYLKQTRGCHPFGMAESILFVPDADHADEGMCLMFLMIFNMEDK